MTLSEFLLERITEDETGARGELEVKPGSGLVGQMWFDLMGRMLAECKAKRQLIEMHEPVAFFGNNPRTNPKPARYYCGECQEEDGVILALDEPCRTLQILAAVYAHHPDYREEWRP